MNSNISHAGFTTVFTRCCCFSFHSHCVSWEFFSVFLWPNERENIFSLKQKIKVNTFAKKHMISIYVVYIACFSYIFVSNSLSEREREREKIVFYGKNMQWYIFLCFFGFNLCFFHFNSLHFNFFLQFLSSSSSTKSLLIIVAIFYLFIFT